MGHTPHIPPQVLVAVSRELRLERLVVIKINVRILIEVVNEAIMVDREIVRASEAALEVSPIHKIEVVVPVHVTAERIQ